MSASLRMRAVGMLVVLLALATVGGTLALEGSSYVLGYLALHIVLAILLVGFSAHVFMATLRLSNTPARASAGLALLSALGATVGGSIFLFVGGNPIALDAMEGLTGVALLGIVLLILFGAEPRLGRATSVR